MRHLFKISFACAVVMLIANVICAQDIIITADAQKIEAKILEVSKTEIKYKEQDNLDGPTFVLETKEIHSIIYSNGKVVLYDQGIQQTLAERKTAAEKDTIALEVQTPTTTTSNVAEANNYNAEIVLMSGQIIKARLMELADNYVAYTFNGKYFTMPSEQVRKVKDLRNGAVTEYNGQIKNKKNIVVVNTTPKYITRKGNTYIYDGRSMRGENYAAFLSHKCPTAYDQYKSGHNVAIAGWVLFGIGVGLDIGFSWWVPYMWIPALGCELACIPTLSVGYVRMHRSADTFNESCPSRSTSYWSLNASQNGIGIAYNF